MDRRGFLKRTVIAGASLGAVGSALAQDTGPKGVKLEKKVPRRELGATGETIPILLFGCAQKFDPKYDKMLHRGFKEGVDYLDTALSYARGGSHKTLAPFIQQVGRKNVWITSKAGPKSFATDIDTCLEQLQVDYLDLYFMHAVNDVKFLEKETLALGEKLKKAKKTRFFGFSCHGGNVVEVMNKAAKTGGIDVIMLRYSFAQYGDKELHRAIDACVEAKIGLVAMKCQNSVPKDQEKVVQFRSKDFTLGQAKMKAVWADERIAAAVSHMDSVDLLKENLIAAKSPIKLSMGDFQQLRRLAACTSPYACLGCSHICESRIDGEVAVADTLRYLMYHEAYGEAEKARELYARLTPAQQDLEGVDFSRATAACPERIDIAARMRRARKLLA
jgi:predicted aldo/keto reductase-like oxidoreductase